MKTNSPSGKRTYVHADRPLADFYSRALVVCPQCADAALAVWDGTYANTGRLSCVHCGYSREKGCFSDYKGRSYPVYAMGGGVDPFFHLPLWIRGSFRGNQLWAYNWEHLDFLEDAIAAELRPGSPAGQRRMRNRLPKWMLLASNREALLRTIRRLRKEKLRPA